MKDQRTFIVDSLRIIDQISEGMVGINNRGSSQNSFLIVSDCTQGSNYVNDSKVGLNYVRKSGCIILVNTSSDSDGPLTTNPRNYDRP